MSDYIKHAMLENTVSEIANLRAVKTQTTQFRVKIGSNLTHEQYCTLVLYATHVYDAQHVSIATSRGTR